MYVILGDFSSNPLDASVVILYHVVRDGCS